MKMAELNSKNIKKFIDELEQEMKSMLKEQTESQEFMSVIASSMYPMFGGVNLKDPSYENQQKYAKLEMHVIFLRNLFVTLTTLEENETLD